MKAKINKTGEVKDLTPSKDNPGWFVDENDNVYQSSELTFIVENAEESMEGFMQKVKRAQENEYWTNIRVGFVRQFIDIYQAPSTNMERILALADAYTKALRKISEGDL